jgi:hypothetical protein
LRTDTTSLKGASGDVEAGDFSPRTSTS